MNAFLIIFGLKKKTSPWGITYDSITKQPLDPAYVILKDMQGRVIDSAITDIDGRYGFLVKPGNYQIMVKKTNYVFPSKKLIGKTKDEIYSDLYFGELVEVKEKDETINKNIPLDPLKFDWNEFAKKDKTIMKFYSRWSLVLNRIFEFLFVAGFSMAILAFVFNPTAYNTTILIMYLILSLLRTLGLKSKTVGYIIDRINGAPLSFAVLKVISPSNNIEVSHKITDAHGRYYCLVPKGIYYVTIDKKNQDGSYALVYISSIVDAQKSGIIKETFKV